MNGGNVSTVCLLSEPDALGLTSDTCLLLRSLRFRFPRASWPTCCSVFAANTQLGAAKVLRVVRLVRIFRVLKLGSRYNKLRIIGLVLSESQDVLAMLIFLLLLAGALRAVEVQCVVASNCSVTNYRMCLQWRGCALDTS
jgi:hypothetical protein